MIFVTVGSQAPFDRLIRAMDRWAETRARVDVFAQTTVSTYRPRHITFTEFLDPMEFNRTIEAASLVVAHAGMGSIISALELGKPIVVMPRRAKFRETRNDHQVAAADWFGAQGRIIVAKDEDELAEKLDKAMTFHETAPITREASPLLITTIRTFLDVHQR